MRLYYKVLCIPLAVFIVAALALAGAQDAQPPLEERLAAKKLKAGDPVFMRIIKEERILELWMKPAGQNKFILFHPYPICVFSGGLGPKIKQGDHKAPEGFYAVGLRQLNPYSKYHLSFDLGYPNAYDRAQGYTGSALMVHGDCRSDGCYAMTDKGIEEIYGLAEAALKKGQPFFRVHAFPFRLTDDNLARFEGEAPLDFWVALKPGYDYFEKHRVPPDIVVKDGSYKLN